MVAIKWIDKYLEEILLVMLLIIMVMLTGFQVFMRYVMNASLTWSEELNRYCYVWSGFLSIGYCIKKCCEIKIDVLVSALPVFFRRITEIAVCVITIFLFLLLTQASMQIVAKILISGQTSSALKLPMQYVYFAPVLGFGIGILRLVQRIVTIIAGPFHEQRILKRGE